MQRTSFLFFLLLALAGIYSLPARADLTVGATREIPDGKLDYTPAVADLSPESGQYAPRIPLEVLPGPAGQAPSLALVYSAKRTNGPLGAGWGLSFESSIERKSKYGGIADMSADDTFWIDGQELIELEDGSYRTEQNDFTVYTKVTGSSGLTRWKALKDGFTRHYGITAGAIGTTDANAVEYRNETSDSGTAAGTREVRWHLSKTKTAFGVEVSYRYIIPEVRPNGETSGRHLPDKIIYAQTSSGWTEVSFAYEERNDIRVSYANGPKRVESKRLRSIVVKGVASAAVSRGVVSGTLASHAHEYLLIYRNAINSPQSLLTEVKRQEVVSRLTVPGTQPGTQSIARFSYADSETTWGEREPITLVGDPAPPAPKESQHYFTLAIPGDVNGDARPDLVVFNDTCHIEKKEEDPRTGDRVGLSLGDEFPPVIIPRYICVTDHRVYLNTIVRSFLPGDVVTNARRPVEPVTAGSHVLQYDKERSDQVNDFYDPWHDFQLKTKYAAIADLNRDGYAELLGEHDFAPGGPDGWDTKGTGATWLSFLDKNQLADINGDGLPDLVGQSGYYLNTGESPYFDLQASVAIEDPVISGDYSTQYNTGTSSASCLNSSHTGIELRWDFGVNGSGQRPRMRRGRPSL